MGAAVKTAHGNPRHRASKLPNRPSRRTTGNPLDKAAGYEVVWPQVSDLFEASRPIKNCSYVYFIGEEDNGPVKIGVAKDPIARLRNMQTGNSRRLRVEHILIGDLAIEKLLHEFWERHAIKSQRNRKRPGAPPGTEWFNAEIRAELFPIVTTAAAEQVKFLNAATEQAIELGDLERIVREAHIAHDFVVQGMDQTILLGAVAGYVVNRRSRL